MSTALTPVPRPNPWAPVPALTPVSVITPVPLPNPCPPPLPLSHSNPCLFLTHVSLSVGSAAVQRSYGTLSTLCPGSYPEAALNLPLYHTPFRLRPDTSVTSDFTMVACDVTMATSLSDDVINIQNVERRIVWVKTWSVRRKRRWPPPRLLEWYYIVWLRFRYIFKRCVYKNHAISCWKEELCWSRF